MSKIVFLDSSVFIRGYNKPDSNSGKILRLMNDGEIQVMILEKVIDELRRYFITYYSKDVWSSVFRHITLVVEVIPREKIIKELKSWGKKLKIRI